MVDTFGLLPFPKLDENQDSYYTAMNQYASFLVVPTNTKDPAGIGAILDAMSYESYENIVPVYYDVTVSQKGLRNEDSIDMLEIIKDARGIELSQVFGITTALQKELQSMTNAGDASAAASTVAAEKASVIANADKLLSSLKN